MWTDRSCLVTGGAGFGGAHLCQLLLDLKARVYVLDRHIPRNSYLHLADISKHIEFLQGDIRDLDTIQLWLERFQIKTIFHLAAQPIVPISNIMPLETFNINALGTYIMLEAMRRSSCVKEFVLASSGAYYGTTFSDSPICEDMPPLPATNLYAPSKVAADIAALCYAKTYNINVVACRFINTYGPGDTNFSRIIPRAIYNLLKKEPYEFGDRDDGSTSLDYMHVGDMAKGYIFAAEKSEQYRGEAFNFGTGSIHTTQQVAKTVSLAYDGKIREPGFYGCSHNQPVTKRLDISKVTKLGWQPHYDFDSGIKETVEWYHSNWNRI